MSQRHYAVMNLLHSFKILALAWLLVGAFPQKGKAQKEAYNWYFGVNAGLTFKTTPPSPLLDGELKTEEGCASISDSLGNLLFYSDGITVYDRNHNIMPWGTQIGGSSTSSQSALIVKKPGSDSLYYLFGVSSAGLFYNVVDMSRNNGLGEVLRNKKFIRLASTTTEKLTATRHYNGKDIWILAHGYNTNIFETFLLRKDGIHLKARQRVGDVHYFFRGYMRFSPTGKMLAVGHDSLEVFDFDTKTGQLKKKLSIQRERVYAVEFSPSERFLYYATRFAGFIYQYDFTLNQSVRITDAVRTGAFQIGPDGKIYISAFDKDYLSTIHFPNKKGAACGFQEIAIRLGRTAREGLPNVLGKEFFPELFFVKDTCQRDKTTFWVETKSERATYKWNFNDPNAEMDSATSDSVRYVFDQAGIYDVTLTIYLNGETKVLHRKVEIKPLPQPMEEPLRRLCPGESTTLDAKNKGASFLWSTGSTLSYIKVKDSGKYSVLVALDGCTSYDTAWVEIKDSVKVDIGKDSTYCPNIQPILDAGSDADSFKWNYGEKTRKIRILKSGYYWVTNYRDGCYSSDSAKIFFHPKPQGMRVDKTICEPKGQIIQLAEPLGIKHFWLHNGDSSQIANIYTEGNYQVNFVDSNGCSDSTQFEVLTKCPYAFYMPNSFTPNGDAINDLYRPTYDNVFNVKMSIFNRWGECVYQAEIGDHNGWDGTFRGEVCPVGVYIYTVYYEFPDGRAMRQIWESGNITILK